MKQLDPDSLMHSYPGGPEYRGNANGLTKREYIAIIAMQGFISTFPCSETITNEVVTGIVKDSLAVTDKLIEELNRE